MKRHIIILASLIGCVLTAGAQQTVDGVTVENLKMERNGKFMAVDMTLDMSGLDVESNRAVLLTPTLINGNDSVELPSVGVYGRRRYYYYVRNGESMLTGEDETSYKAAHRPDSVEYSRLLPYKNWMDGARLAIHRSDYGCCSSIVDEQYAVIGRYREAFFPDLVYVKPQAEVKKVRKKEGSAFIDFPVDRTVIYPDYRRNAVELAKIQSSIDSVRNDRDVSITQVWLKGYASPESPYAHNEDLAIRRTSALKHYIEQLYRFEDGIIDTDHEPEDWAGLRKYVERSNIDNKKEILEIIDNGRDPDTREWMLKSTYPEQYRLLLDNCYPALRHTDYRIVYNVRRYSDAEEIERIMKTQPQKLSLNELYLVAQKYEPGTAEFTEVFETAVRMFPDDPTANLNAANAAMRRGDNAAAARYLDKAGDSPEAVYAKGALAIRMEDYDKARTLLTKAKDLGEKQAGTTLEQLED